VAMKLTKELAVVICVMIAGAVGLILGLAVLADWSDGAILAMFSLFASIATGLIAAVRNQQKTTETLDNLQRQVGSGQRDQDTKISTIVKQTNDLSDLARQDIADKAVRTVMGERSLPDGQSGI
jgi:hypothetical protein